MITATAHPGTHPSNRADRGHVVHAPDLIHLNNNRRHNPTLGEFISVDPHERPPAQVAA